MRQRKPYVKRYKDGGAVLADEPSAQGMIAAELSAEAAPAPDQAAAAPVALDGHKPQLNQRDEQLRQWRQQGLSGAQARFFASHAYMMDTPGILATAAQVAKDTAQECDLEPDSPEYFEVLKVSYDEFSKPSPRYFELPGSEPSGHRERSDFVSAPVERHVPTGGTYQGSGQISLTPAQREAAKIAGVSEASYAEHLRELREHQANGLYGGQP